MPPPLPLLQPKYRKTNPIFLIIYRVHTNIPYAVLFYGIPPAHAQTRKWNSITAVLCAHPLLDVLPLLYCIPLHISILLMVSYHCGLLSPSPWRTCTILLHTPAHIHTTNGMLLLCPAVLTLSLTYILALFYCIPLNISILLIVYYYCALRLPSPWRTSALLLHTPKHIHTIHRILLLGSVLTLSLTYFHSGLPLKPGCPVGPLSSHTSCHEGPPAVKGFIMTQNIAKYLNRLRMAGQSNGLSKISFTV